MNYEKLDADFERLNKGIFKTFLIITGVLIAVCIAFYITPSESIAKSILLIVIAIIGIPFICSGGIFLFNTSLRKELIKGCKNGEYD